MNTNTKIQETIKEITIDMFDEHNAVFKDNKKVADNPDFPLCVENATYQNEIRELFYETLNKYIEKMKNITTSLGCGVFHNEMTAIFFETLADDYYWGSDVTFCIKDFCSDAIDIKLEETGVIDRVYGESESS